MLPDREQMKEPEALPLDFRTCIGRQGMFRKILSALKKFAPKEQLQAAVVLPDTEEETVRLYLKEACEAGFDRGQLQVLGEAESLVHFTMHQTADIWQQGVWFLEFGQEEVRATCLKINRRMTPLLVETQEPEYWHVGNLLEGSRDERLAETVKERFGKMPGICGVPDGYRPECQRVPQEPGGNMFSQEGVSCGADLCQRRVRGGGGCGQEPCLSVPE